MTKEQIDKLISEGIFPEPAGKLTLVETHISWIILADYFAYKIKKPVYYSFLDFSSLEKRKHYCEREIELNKRLTENIYINVQPVRESAGHYSIGQQQGEIIDYAVCMQKKDTNLQMDILLSNNKVSRDDIYKLTLKIATFHKNASVLRTIDLMDIPKKFIDLKSEKDFLEKELNNKSHTIISHAIDTSNSFMEKNKELLANRLKEGFFRDCHGDLHARNIFLLPEPQPFDCIEFNDEFRQIDVLNEVAFLCMDLDAFDRPDLSDLFISFYNSFFPCMRTREERRLFIYYKSYRANVRAKVNSLRARSAVNETVKTAFLKESYKYLCLMNNYINLLTID